MVSVSLTKTGIDQTSDTVLNTNILALANSVENLFNAILNGTQAADSWLFSSAATLTISNGAVEAPSQIINYIASETGTIDTLSTIGASNGTFILIKAAAGHTITIDSGAGNITTLGENDITLTGNTMLMGICDGSQWSFISDGGVKNNLTATADPGSGDDTFDGYNYGSLFINTLKDRGFINVAPNGLAARWPKITPDVNSWSYKAAAITVLGVGVAAPTIANTPLTNSNSSNGTFVTLPTTTSSGNLGGIVSPTFNLLRLAYDPVVEWLIATDSNILNLRLWIGLTSADATSSDAAAGSFVGFRYSTVASDTGFMMYNRDGTNAATPTLLKAILASTVYKLRIRFSSSGAVANFSINDEPEVAFSNNLPATTTDLGQVCRPITQTTAIRLINFSYFKAGW